MPAAAGSVAAGVAAFAATNIDDLFLLVAFVAAGSRPRDVVLGQYAGITALFAASAAAASASVLVPGDWLRWLGLLPIAIGVSLWLNRRRDSGEARILPGLGALSVASATVANGADNIGLYVPLFAVSSLHEVVLFGATFIVMTALWCLGALWLARRPAAGAPLRRWGPLAAPWALIAIGAWIVLG